MVNLIRSMVEKIEGNIYTHMQILLYKTISLKARNDRNKVHKKRGKAARSDSSYSIVTSDSLESSSDSSSDG